VVDNKGDFYYYYFAWHWNFNVQNIINGSFGGRYLTTPPRIQNSATLIAFTQKSTSFLLKQKVELKSSKIY